VGCPLTTNRGPEHTEYMAFEKLRLAVSAVFAKTSTYLQYDSPLANTASLLYSFLKSQYVFIYTLMFHLFHCSFMLPEYY